MKLVRSVISFIGHHPILVVIVLSELSAFAFCMPYTVTHFAESGLSLPEFFITETGPIALLFFVYVSPIVITLYNIGYLFVPHQSQRTKRAGRVAEYVTIIYGALCSMFYMGMGIDAEVVWESHWSDQLYNNEVHSPVSQDHLPTLGFFITVVFAGYIILRVTRGRNLPPIPTAFCIGSLYIGIAVCVLFTVQIAEHKSWVSLYLLNIILIIAKLIRDTAENWHEKEHTVPEGKSIFVTSIYSFAVKSKSLPWVGFLAALPLLGLCIAFLALFGQSPDSIIRVWTETADWSLSDHTGPQNIVNDMHYLCTVAAGGHRKIVKPLRTGKRHGHEVIVNRQLCVANAFEGLLQERLPRFHRFVRYIYDKYGYPIARHIKSPYIADAVWILMKPAEWMFLAVLYTFDEKPENRIAVQYPHTVPPKI